MWSQLNNFLNLKSFNVIISKRIAFFGYNKMHYQKNVLNYIIFLMKFYIIRSKYRKTDPNFQSFLNYLQLNKDIEAEIALRNDKIEIHNEKWRFF